MADRERKVVEVCPHCFSATPEVRGYTPPIIAAPPQRWPKCDDRWHDDPVGGLRVAFDADAVALIGAK